MRLGLLVMALGIAACAGTGQPPGNAGVAAAPAPASVGPAAPAVAATPNPVLTVTNNVPGGQDYLIGPQDLLKIEVFGIEAMNRSVRVGSSGQIVLPLIGSVQAAGLTSEQLAADIAARLRKDYLQNPQVIIFIEEFTSQRVTVVGGVKNPGVFPVKGRTTLLQVVANAGGPTSVADISSVKILRPEPDPEIRGVDVVQVDVSPVKDTAKQMLEFVMPFWIFAR